MNNRIKILTVILSSALLLTIFGIAMSSEGITNKNGDEVVIVPGLNRLVVTDFDRNIESADASLVDLEMVDDDVVVLSSGNYYLTGKCKGTVIVRASDEKVHLFLDNVSITSEGGPALIVESADKVVITLVEGSENYIGDNGIYDLSEEYDACIDSDASITINGKGSLKISGLYKDALHTKDVLKILDCDVKTECKRTSFQGNDGILLKNASFFIESEKNGFKTTKSDASDRGYIVVDGCEMSIISGRVSFISKSDLYIIDSNIIHRSVVSLYETAGSVHIQEGCVK